MIQIAFGIVLSVLILTVLPAFLRIASLAFSWVVLIAVAGLGIWLFADHWPYSLYLFALGAGLIGLCALTHVKRWDTRYLKPPQGGQR